jgi:SNF2 family DNA or RNA helicase
MTNNWTNYHAKYFAYELTQRFASRVTAEGFNDSDNLDKLTASLSDAQVDLNPHQVDAALFALRSPLSQGVILADEVGLGKTIEAGIVISQRWAERKRRILIIAPANLRKQWSQELADKFFLPSLILEKKSFDNTVNEGNFNPFNQDNKIVIASFQFIRSKEAYVSRTDWDLVIIDEAHRLRNVYRKDNKIGNAIKNALHNKPKILLTATPLQNSLLELFGLVSLVDDYLFGDLKSFR